MGIDQVRSLEETLRHIENSGVDVEIYFDGGTNIVGKISYVGSDFVELSIPVPGGSRKAVCPFGSIRYLSAEYEEPRKLSEDRRLNRT